MSKEALGWALKQQAGDPIAKFVLILLAERATAYVNELFAWDSLDIDELARDGELDRPAVQRALETLEAGGWIQRRATAAGHTLVILGASR